MKTLVIILSMAGLLTLTSCSQKTDPNTLLKDDNTRTELFSAIVSNPQMMTQFMNTVKANKGAMQMMRGNKQMMGKMMGGNGMMSMMKNNPEMMKNMSKMMSKDMEAMHLMMNNMMKDGNMMKMMVNMMNKNGLMNKKSMESCLKIMKDKGMNMDDLHNNSN
jgi:hypothetical protein